MAIWRRVSPIRRHEVDKTYHAVVRGVPSAGTLAALARGVVIDGRRTAPADVRLVKSFRTRSGGDGAVVELILREGRNRQVRRMCEYAGHPVEQLRRIRIGPLTDPALAVGAWRDLTAAEVSKLKRVASATHRRSLRLRRPAVDVTALRRVLLAAAMFLLALAAAAAVGYRLSVEIGGVAVSARRAPALLAQGCAALLLAMLVGAEGPTRVRKRVVGAIVVALLIALVAESSPRRTGDGGEYLVMARNFSRGAPPSIAAAEVAAAQTWLDGLPGFQGATLRDGLVPGRNGRSDFAHFWLYPLAVAPVLRLTDAFGWHPTMRSPSSISRC